MPPIRAKTGQKYLRLILSAFLSIAFLGIGSAAAGLLFQEEDVLKAIFLFLAASFAAAGSLFFFYRFLRQISPKNKGPFIPTLP